MGLAGIALGLSAGSSLMGGILGAESAGQEADALRQQGQQTYQDYAAQAEKTVKDAATYKETQAVSYLKSGVMLEGTPLGVLAETTARAQDEANSLVSRGTAERELSYKKAKITESEGRAGLFASVGGALGEVFSGIAQASRK